MGQASYKIKGEKGSKDIIHRMEGEILKLESLLKRLQAEDAPHKDSMMKTYSTMIKSRKEVLEHMFTFP